MIPLRRQWVVAAGVVALLALHALLALRAVATKSLTVDEIYHLTGGYLYNQFGDYRIHPDNGVLPQRWHALPAVLMGAKPPPMAGNEYWRTSDVNVISYQFFYESGNDHWPLLMAARAMNLVFALALLLLVFFWARRLGGDLAGFVALGVGAFSPLLLAHGPLATTDTSAALFLTASAGAFWWQLGARDWRVTLLSALVAGAACTAKYSAVLLVPVCALLAGVHWLTTPRAERRAGRLWLGVAAHVAVAWVFIWACFGFRYTAFAPGVPPADHFIRHWQWMIDHAGWQGRVIAVLRDWRLFPEAFLFGYTHTYVGSLTRAAFLAGEYSDLGWRSFFPLVFLWKSTPVELAVVVLGAAAVVVRRARAGAWLLRLAPLLALAGVYGVVAIFSNLNIGHRHLLPMYPALFIVAGLAASRLWHADAARRGAGAALLAGQLLSAALIHPHYLAYFNFIAGGPASGWRLLVDSSLDWGQDLAGLRRWLDAHNTGPDAQPVFLSYFGNAEPAYYRIDATRLVFVNGFKIPHVWWQPRAGLYCIGATMLQQVYSPARGPWTPEREKEYQELRAFDEKFRQFFREPAAREHLLTLAPEQQWINAWHRFDLLRLARLTAFLRARPPDATIGHSIFIHRLTDADLAAVLEGPYSAWLAAVESAAESSSLPAR